MNCVNVAVKRLVMEGGEIFPDLQVKDLGRVCKLNMTNQTWLFPPLPRSTIRAHGSKPIRV